MHFEEKMHEFLPALCLAMGAIFVAGAAYIGIGHAFTVGYAMIGVACMIGGTSMAIIRHKTDTDEVTLDL